MVARATSTSRLSNLKKITDMIQVQILVQNNHLTNQKVASARIVNLQEMKFARFCEYLAQDSTVGEADVAAVMTQFAKKLPLLIAMGMKVYVSPDDMVVKPTIKGSLTQAQLTAKLTARKAELLAAGDTEAANAIDVNRLLKASDLKTSDLTAGLDIDFGSKFVASFGKAAELERVSKGTPEPTSTPSNGGGNNGGEENVIGSVQPIDENR